MNPVADIAGLSALWQRASGGDPAVRIAIIDGPVDLNHPSLSQARVAMGGHFVAPSSSPIQSEHGTHVTSVLMGTPGSPVLGVAPNCSATVFSIYRENAAGQIEPSSQSTLALAINQALAAGADVINISSGQQSATGQADRILVDAVRACERAGRLIVAAAGNDGCRCVQVPGSLGSVLAVGACDLAGNPLPFSNFGDAYLENGLLAPGENVAGASPVRNVSLRSGTSFAAPIVTGVVALLLSCLRRSGRKADPQAVRAALLESAAPCRNEGSATRCLAGRLDIPAAVAALLGEQADAVMPSGATAAPPRFWGVSARPFVQPSSAAQPTATREGSMGDLSATSAPSAPRIYGPDGSVLRSSAAVMPSEAQPAAAPAPVAAAAPVEQGAIAAPIAAPAPYAYHAPHAGGDMVWMPTPSPQMAMPPMMMPQMMPQMVMPAAGMAPQAWLQPQQLPALMPNNALPVAMPQALPMYEAPAVRTSSKSCGCGGGLRPQSAAAESTGQLAFPIGRLFYDFGKEARLDYFVQAIAGWRDSLIGRGDPMFGPDRDRSGDTSAPYNPAIMARYLLNQPEGEAQTPTGLGNNFPDADAIIWTLTIDSIPIYAVKPLDVFGLGFFVALILALWHQEVSHEDPATTRTVVPLARTGDDTPPSPSAFPGRGGVARVSMAGWVDSADTTKLLNGTVVPTLVTDWRGFYQWDLYTLFGPDPDNWPAGAEGFLERIYNEFRNVGLSPQDRALNYSAMNAYNTRKIFADVAKKGLRLDSVEVDKSVICRPESICHDVTYRFFNPTQVLTQAREVYQYTIDVSDVVPVAVGPLRQWQVY
ncbi:S8 family serine peptidase [Bradyrhizobium ivorense]|uniref:S8 family serine peptidase n=1 Tax=Bradyrhizobium ivorense TaxID=2511166 RepID=UPI0010BC4150|nr:S8 family serine peptidase [Bradyrhizobium ivorense]VIO67167.1 Thermophilic serine proteinase [Bradyrhizobium ivorense]